MVTYSAKICHVSVHSRTAISLLSHQSRVVNTPYPDIPHPTSDGNQFYAQGKPQLPSFQVNSFHLKITELIEWLQNLYEDNVWGKTNKQETFNIISRKA